MHDLAARAVLIWVLMLRQVGLAPHVAPTATAPPTPEQLAQFWEEPTDLPQRDLFAGPWKISHVPSTGERYAFRSRKTSGFSPGYDVKDASGDEWSVKLGPEAQTEVVASRLLSAIGYRQPPVFYVSEWTLTDGPSPGLQGGARFRPKDGVLKTHSTWSWQQNPFVNSQPFRGLIVMMLLLNSTDLRNENNVVYTVRDAALGPRRWYVVKDLGATFGETGVYRPRRNYLEGFEREPFLVKDGDTTKFGYRGLQKELLRLVTAADIRWTCALLDRLSDDQWRESFRAGGYSADAAARYIETLRARIQAAEALPDDFKGEASDFWTSRQLRQADRLIRKLPDLVPEPRSHRP